jgi:hypothetical protein
MNVAHTVFCLDSPLHWLCCIRNVPVSTWHWVHQPVKFESCQGFHFRCHVGNLGHFFLFSTRDSYHQPLTLASYQSFYACCQKTEEKKITLHLPAFARQPVRLAPCQKPWHGVHQPLRLASCQSFHLCWHGGLWDLHHAKALGLYPSTCETCTMPKGLAVCPSTCETCIMSKFPPLLARLPYLSHTGKLEKLHLLDNQ